MQQWEQLGPLSGACVMATSTCWGVRPLAELCVSLGPCQCPKQKQTGSVGTCISVRPVGQTAGPGIPGQALEVWGRHAGLGVWQGAVCRERDKSVCKNIKKRKKDLGRINISLPLNCTSCVRGCGCIADLGLRHTGHSSDCAMACTIHMLPWMWLPRQSLMNVFPPEPNAPGVCCPLPSAPLIHSP